MDYNITDKEVLNGLWILVVDVVSTADNLHVLWSLAVGEKESKSELVI